METPGALLHLREDFEVRLPPEGRMARKHDEEDHPQGPNVYLLGVGNHLPAQDLFGDIGGSAYLGSQGLATGIILSCCEVNQFRGGLLQRTLLQQEVILQLNVPMADAVLMQAGHGQYQLPQEPWGPADPISPIFLVRKTVIEPTQTEFQDHKDLCFTFEGLKESANVGMPETPQDADLFPHLILIWLHFNFDGNRDFSGQMYTAPDRTGVPVIQMFLGRGLRSPSTRKDHP